MFPEYQGKGLLALVLDLRHLVPTTQSNGLEKSLRAAEELPALITRARLVKPVGQEDSRWTIDADGKARYQILLATAFDGAPLDWRSGNDGQTNP
jgi:hypothetical protein